jgi:hypothetical protein
MGTLEKLREVIDELAEMDPHDLASMDDTLALAEATDRIEAITTRAFAAFDASHDWMLANCYSAAYWLSWKRNMHVGAARRRQRLGRALRSMPATEAAWIAGEITDQHVAKLADAQKAVPEVFDRDEKVLVDNARTPALWLVHPGRGLLGGPGRPRRRRGDSGEDPRRSELLDRPELRERLVRDGHLRPDLGHDHLRGAQAHRR